VQHNPNNISSNGLQDALNAFGFGARVKVDGAEQLYTTTAIPTNVFVDSILLLSSSSTNASEKKVQDALYGYILKGWVQHIEVYDTTTTCKITHNPYYVSASKLCESIIMEDGRATTIVHDGAADGKWALPVVVRGKEHEHDDEEEEKGAVRPAVALSGFFWILSILSILGGNWSYLKYTALLSVVLGLPAIARKALGSMMRLSLDTNCFVLFAILGAVAIQEFIEAAAVTFVFRASEYLEARATIRARTALGAIVKLRPDRALLVNPITHDLVHVPASLVAVGATVSVKSGEKVPCDGIVKEGESTLNESSLTGESRPVHKQVGDEVYGGTINTGSSPLMVRTTSTVDDSAVAKLIRLVEEAQAHRSETEKMVDRFAKYYTPAVLAVAILMCTLPWIFHGRDTGLRWVHNGLVLIVIACPCALVISTPVTYVAGLAATARRGVLVKGGAHLEALGMVKRIAFDKTGTLTEGHFLLHHLEVIGTSLSRTRVLEYLALLESRASHPMAEALVAAARNEGVCVPTDKTVTDHTILKGEGIEAKIDGSILVHVGNERLFQRLYGKEAVAAVARDTTRKWTGCTVGFMGIEGLGIVCAYGVSDAVRKEARNVVENLISRGIKLKMLTGDSHEAALAIGSQIGLSHHDVHSQLLPRDKVEFVRSMKDNDKNSNTTTTTTGDNDNNDNTTTTSIFGGLCCLGKSNVVLMCGDGVNDAPALATANVGVAMGQGAALAMETSDVTLLDSDLTKIVYAMDMGRRVISTIIENVAFSLLSKLTVMVVTLATGRVSLWAAIACDVGAMLIVTLNGMKLLPGNNNNDDNNNKKEEDEVVAKLVVESKACCENKHCCSKDDVESANDGVVASLGVHACCENKHCCNSSDEIWFDEDEIGTGKESCKKHCPCNNKNNNDRFEEEKESIVVVGSSCCKDKDACCGDDCCSCCSSCEANVACSAGCCSSCPCSCSNDKEEEKKQPSYCACDEKQKKKKCGKDCSKKVVVLQTNHSFCNDNDNNEDDDDDDDDDDKLSVGGRKKASCNNKVHCSRDGGGELV